MHKGATSLEFFLCVDQPAALHKAAWWKSSLCRLESLWVGYMQTWVALGDLLPAFSQGWPCTVFAYVIGVLTMQLQEAGLRTQPWHPS